MTLIGNYTGNGADWLGVAQLRLTAGDIGILCRGGQWPALQAVNLATGTTIWSRDGAEGGDLILQYDPLLIDAGVGKLLVRVEARTQVAYEYESLGVVDGFANNGLEGVGLEIYDWVGLPCTNQLFPFASSYYEVIGLETGDSLAVRSLDLGAIEHEIPVPSGAIEVTTSGPYPLEADTDYNSYASPPREMWWLASTPAQPLSLYQPIAYDGFWWHYIGNGADPDLGTPPVGGASYWIKRGLVAEPAQTPIPPPHDPRKCAALPGGLGIVFGPNPTPGANLSYDVLISGTPTIAAWGDPHTDGHAQSLYAYNWDLEDLWSVDLGQVAAPGQPVAVGDSVLLAWLDVGDPEAPVSRYRRFNPEDGSMVAESIVETAELSTERPIITSTRRLVRIDDAGAAIVNLAPPEEP